MKALFGLPAPAKLNLFLHITGQRTDGYHLIESVFQLINWCDFLDLECRSDGKISREDVNSALPLPSDDLCVRAATALQSASGTSLGCHIRLQKNIPAQAGMGGGSSDAATVLIGLNHLWNLRKPLSELEQIGLALGADLPFFLRGKNAWVSGIGEIIEPLPPTILNAEQSFIVIKPERGLPTPRIFKHSALKRNTAHAIISDFADDPYGFGCNDLQAVGELIEPEVNQALELLRQQGLKPRMTGSGSAVFAPCSLDFQAHKMQVPASWQQRICKSLKEHPIGAVFNALPTCF